MAKVYFDTGALVKLYIVEPGSAFVQSRAQRAGIIPINPLQETELRNAILAAGGRRVIGREAMQRSLDNLEEDLSTGVFTRETPEWPWIYRRADLLARQYTPRFSAARLMSSMWLRRNSPAPTKSSPATNASRNWPRPSGYRWSKFPRPAADRGAPRQAVPASSLGPSAS